LSPPPLPTIDLNAGSLTVTPRADEELTCTFTNTNDTVPVTLSYFFAQRVGDSVLFTWQTATEMSSAGFNLHGDTATGPVKLSTELIPSAVIDLIEPTDYEYRVVTNADRFLLEEIDLMGVSELHGPFNVGERYGQLAYLGAGSASQQVYLPYIQR
jgi:hypothetical protein